MTWNTQKLDDLLFRMQQRVNDGLLKEGDEGCAGVIGFWMLQLRDCQEQPPPKPAETACPYPSVHELGCQQRWAMMRRCTCRRDSTTTQNPTPNTTDRREPC